MIKYGRRSPGRRKMGIEWTGEQLEVINARGKSVLVSAAAGSGKTAVLVERIIRMLTDPDHPVDIDRLLVVTFTDAAASEMRERIGKGLDEKLALQPDNTAWQRQKLLLGCAHISTIDSFCLKLIRENFNILDIDPSFRIADDAEIRLLKSDVADDFMEVCYASGNKGFRDFVERYGTGRTDEGIAGMILKVYDFAQGMPDPSAWYEQCRRIYRDGSVPGSEQGVIRGAFERIGYLENKWRGLLNLEQELCMQPSGPRGYIKVIASDREQIEKLSEISDYDEIRGYLNEISWMRLPKVPADTDLSLKDEVSLIRSEIKNDVKDLKVNYFAQPAREAAQEMAYLLPSVEMLTQLAEFFSERFTLEKKNRNILDFSDLEHLTLKLLVNFSSDENGQLAVSSTAAADELSKAYDEVICDEYQDSNKVQEMILDVLSAERFGRFNRFMVGDVKQSIYRFRRADASIFTEKYNSYAPFSTGENRVRKDLHQNFRSREKVLFGVNFIFSHLMIKELGGISYDEDAKLYPGMAYPEPGAGDINVGGPTELLLVNTEGDEDDTSEFTNAELEAKAVAARIHELTDPEKGISVYDSKTGKYRRAGYNDIVILLRTMSGWAETFVEILGQENIPAAARMSEGFFDTTEIRTMVDLLTVTDNPRQDIPLAAVLKSPVAGLDSEELAFIRANSPDSSFYDACVNYGHDMPGYGKLKAFLDMLDDFRNAALYMPLTELIRMMYDRTGYYDYVQALAGGRRRRANLDLLITRAAEYSSGSYSGLFNFVRYLGQLKENDIDFGEADIPREGLGNVRILSIHRSKGLEFPIVILSGLGKSINFTDMKENPVMDPGYGIGIDAVNPSNRRKFRSANKKYIAGRIKKDTLAEEQRMLYVAMTRAREKLIMTGFMKPGTKKDPNAKFSKWERASYSCISLPGDPESGGGPFAEWAVTEVNTYLDWIVPCMMLTDAMKPVMESRGLGWKSRGSAGEGLFDVRMTDLRELAGREVERTLSSEVYKEKLLSRNVTREAARSTRVGEDLTKDDEFRYAWENILQVKGKYTVSEIKKDSQLDDEAQMLTEIPDEIVKEEELPSFMKDYSPDQEGKGKTDNAGTFRGTAYHRVMELLDFGNLPDSRDIGWVRARIDEMHASGKLTDEQYKCVRVRDICDMAFSVLGRRMSEAAAKGSLKREVQYVMSMPVSMVRPDIDSDDPVIVQGVIDAYFEENGKIVVVDYKTDRVGDDNGAQILVSRYESQLRYYQYALEEMTGMSAGEKIIYSFALKKAISV